jgi:DNA-binding NarL/FixJ family response regulator
MSNDITKLRIFLVEDHKQFRQLMALTLNMHSELVICGDAGSGRQALEAIPETGARLIIADLSLPDMSGVELVEKIKARWPEIKCFILSGHTEAAYVEQARNSGADAFIEKEEPKKMLGAIMKAMEADAFVHLPDESAW